MLRDVRRWDETAQNRQNFFTALPTTRTRPPQGKPDLSLKQKNFQNSHLAVSSSTYVQNKHRLQIWFLSVTLQSIGLAHRDERAIWLRVRAKVQI